MQNFPVNKGHLFGAAALICPPLCVFVPLAMTSTLISLAVFSLLLSPIALPKLTRKNVGVPVFVAVLVWSALTLVWTPDPGAPMKLLRVGVMFLAGLVIITAASNLPSTERDFFRKCLTIGLLSGFGALIVAWIIEFDLLPFVEPGEEKPGKMLSRFNRGTTIISLLVWPAILAFSNRPKIAGLVYSAALILCTQLASTAAIAGLLIGGAAFLIAWYWPKASKQLLLGCVLFYMAAGPVLHAFVLDPARAGVTGDALEQEYPWVPRSSYHRLLIWNFTAKKIVEAPIAGWGFNGSRDIPGASVKLDNQESALPLHPHNAPLQVWLELGAIGAVFATLLCWLLLQSVAAIAQTQKERAAGSALFAAGFIVICVSYGAWQSWWLGTLFVIAAFMVAARNKRSDPGSE